MKKKIDIYLIYFTCLVEMIMIISDRIFSNYSSTNMIQVAENGKPIYGKMEIFFNIFVITYYMLFALMIAYIIVMIIKARNKYDINLKKNFLLSLILVVIELINCGFLVNSTIIISSVALKFVAVVLITNMFFYAKYKSQIQNGIIKW